MRVSRRYLLSALASAIALSSVGCATIVDSTDADKPSWRERLPWASKKDAPPEPYPNPVKMAVTWTSDTLYQPGKTPTRGFGGRVFFYNDHSKPVPVEGTLTVHGFDDSMGGEEDSVKRFVFTPEQFTRHFSQSDFGASYSIWVPWDAVGGDQRRISLAASFTTVEGKAVQGVPTTVLLPGKTPDAETQLADKLSPQFRKWQLASSGDAVPNSGLTTTTIARSPRPQASSPYPSARPKQALPMVAQQSSTPSQEINMARPKPAGTTVFPASARLPATR